MSLKRRDNLCAALSLRQPLPSHFSHLTRPELVSSLGSIGASEGERTCKSGMAIARFLLAWVSRLCVRNDFIGSCNSPRMGADVSGSVKEDDNAITRLSIVVRSKSI